MRIEEYNEISGCILNELTEYSSGKDNGTTMKSILVGVRICLNVMREFVGDNYETEE